ncbi:MAG: hypothetical protein ACYC46_13665 [Acidobacteriaceae bacterium]
MSHQSEVVETISNGSAAAAILAMGVGSCALGLLAVAADGSKEVAKLLTFYTPTGPLSGVSTVAILVWMATWLLLTRVWRARTVALTKINAVALVLLGIGLLLTFPPLGNFLLGR